MLSPRGSKSFWENRPASWWHNTKINHGRGTLHVWFGESVSPVPLTGLRWDTPSNFPQERPSVFWELLRIWKTFKMMESTGKHYQTFKGEIISIQTLPEYGRGGNIIQFSWDTQIPKPKTSKDISRSISLLSMDSKLLNKILANQIQKYMKS